MSNLLWAVERRLDLGRVLLIEWVLTRRGVPHSPQERMRRREGNQLNTVEQCREWASQVRTPGERVQLRRHLLKSEAGRAFMESEEGRDALAGA